MTSPHPPTASPRAGRDKRVTEAPELAAKRARLGVADLRERRRRRLDEAGVADRCATGG